MDMSLEMRDSMKSSAVKKKFGVTRTCMARSKKEPDPGGLPGCVVVQLLSCVWLFVTLWPAARQASLSFTNFWSLFKLMSIESVMPSNHLILWHPLLLPSVFPSIRVFSNESSLHIRWPKYCNFSFSISASNEYSGLIYFRIEWFDLLVLQGTLESSPTPRFKMIWGGWWEGGSELGTHVHPWLIHVNVWQYSIVKQNEVKIKKKKLHPFNWI